MKKVTGAFDIYALSLALREAIDEVARRVVQETGLQIVGEVRWSPINEEQGELLQYYELVEEHEIATLEELKAWVRDTAEELNAILAEHGFSIRLEAWSPSPGRFGVVAIYDITIMWLIEGAIKDADGEPYLYDEKPFFSLPRIVPQEEPPFEDLPQIEFLELPGNDNIVIRIPGKRTGDSLCLTQAAAPLTQFELIEAANAYRGVMAQMQPIYWYDDVQLPNLLYDSEVDGPIDISWLIGLQTHIEVEDPDQDENPIIKWLISQAKMQAKFAMGPKGARAKVAVAVGLEKAVSLPSSYVANHDLLIWMERDGVTTAPFFAIYVPKGAFADHIVDLDEI